MMSGDGGALASLVDGEELVVQLPGAEDRHGFAVDAETVDRLECLAFRVGDETYALEISALREIVLPTKITAVPRGPAHVLGVMSLRGNMVTVVDLRAALGFEASEAEVRRRILVVENDEDLYGLVVDAVHEVVRFPVASLEAPPAGGRGAEAQPAKGIVYYDRHLLILLDLARVLDLDGPGGARQRDADALPAGEVRAGHGASAAYREDE